jgi:hypothetical protein
LLSEDLTFSGSVAGVLILASILFAVISWGVTIGAITNSTVLGITLFWIVLYGTGFLLSLLPQSFPAPDRILAKLPAILRGNFDGGMLGDVVLVSFGVALIAGIVGMISFSRKDV